MGNATCLELDLLSDKTRNALAYIHTHINLHIYESSIMPKHAWHDAWGSSVRDVRPEPDRPTA